MEKKIYGVYPGSLTNVEAINEMDEISLFLSLDSLTKYIFDTHERISKGNLPDMDITEQNYALEYMMYQTTRFGVVIQPPEEGKHVQISSSYLDWYTYYTKHFHDNMEEETFNKFLEEKRKGKDISNYLPEKTWSELHKGFQITKKAANE